MLGLYLHIPFCQSICGYCNFNRGLLDDDLKRAYVSALEREIREARWPGPIAPPAGVDTIYFGGGTPSLLDPGEVARLIRACHETFTVDPETEVTLETNPETATADRFAAFLDAGVNRFSVGVQSFDDEELARLDRRHSAARACEAIRAARQAGARNVSLDLMLWLPGQSRASWLKTVDRAIALGPDHLSLYLLEIYPNAPLKEAMARAAWTQAPDDDAADMYLDGLARLDTAGFQQYEISNVARPGRASRHNLKYWEAGAWRGFGCGAHSTVDGWRWHNVAGAGEYISRLGAGSSTAASTVRLSDRERVSEALFMGMRLSAGLDRDVFLKRFGVDPWEKYGAALAPGADAGLLWTRDARFGLTREGMLVANDILAVFV